jgi:hypothetical protein
VTLPPLNILAAYPVAKGIIPMVQDPRVRFLLDSGAFSAHNSGRTVTLADYLAFVRDLGPLPWRYFTLDRIGDPGESWRRYQVARDAGFSPVPVYTLGAPLGDLDRYWEGSDLVGLGGLVRHGGRNFPIDSVATLIRHAAGRWLHLLGVAGPKYVQAWRPYSCDSSGWDQARYGKVRLHLGLGRVVQWSKEAARRGPPPVAVAQALLTLGFDPYALRAQAAWRGELISRINAAAMVHYSMTLEMRLGVRQFFAVGSARDVGLLLDGYEAAAPRVRQYLAGGGAEA